MTKKQRVRHRKTLVHISFELFWHIFAKSHKPINPRRNPFANAIKIFEQVKGFESTGFYCHMLTSQTKS